MPPNPTLILFSSSKPKGIQNVFQGVNEWISELRENSCYQLLTGLWVTASNERTDGQSGWRTDR